MSSTALLRRFVPALVLCCLVAAHALADVPKSSCPASFPLQAPSDSAALAAESARLSGLSEICRSRADYFAYWGIVLLSQRNVQQAANSLEKALLLNPDLAGAQLDYAQALAELGEVTAARRLAQDVSRRPDIPLALQAWLVERLRELGQPVWRLEWSVQAMAGSESNLNSAPSIQALTLTLPGGDVPVALADNEHRRPGRAQRMNLTALASRPIGDGLLLLNGEISIRRSPGNDDTDQRIQGINAAYLQPFLSGQIGGHVSRAKLSIGGQDIFDGNGWGLMYVLPESLSPDGCRSNLSREYERRDFPAAPILAGAYAGNRMSINCRKGDWTFNIALQAGTDRAKDDQRLGGDQRRSDLIGGVSHPLGNGAISLSAQREQVRDREIYSTFLGGRPRAVDRSGGRIGYEYPLTQQFSIFGYYEKTLQNSNIDLFNIESDGIYFGVKFRGP